MPERKATFCMTVRLDLQKSRFRNNDVLPATIDIVGKKELKLSGQTQLQGTQGCDPPSIVQHVETGMNVFAHRNLSRAPNGTRLSRRYVPQVPTQIAAQCIPVDLYETIEQLLYDPAPRSTQLCSGLISKNCGVCRMASLGSSEYGVRSSGNQTSGKICIKNTMKGADVRAKQPQVTCFSTLVCHHEQCS
jgi:hypothetical protein